MTRPARPRPPVAYRSERTKKVQQVLLLLSREFVEVGNNRIAFRAAAGVLFNRVQQSAVGGTGAAIVQEEDALPQTPQRRGAEFVGPAEPCETLSARPVPIW